MPIAKVFLSGSVGGRPVLVANDGSPGTLVHETGTSAAVLDEVWLYIYNGDDASVDVTVEFGDDDPSDGITISVEASQGLTLVIPGIPLAGTGAGGRAVRAYASVENVVTVSGYVNRITP